MSRKGLSWVECVVIIVIAAIAAVALLPVIRGIRDSREARRPSYCKSNLKQIGLACAMYANDYGESWPRIGGRFPDGTQSLALLYDNYVSSLNVFRCSSTQDTAGFASGSPNDVTTSYQYDPSTAPRADPMKTVAADFGDTTGRLFGPRANHPGDRSKGAGANVLYYDGHVEWQNSTMNFYTGDDSIYNSGKWNEWTHSYVRF